MSPSVKTRGYLSNEQSPFEDALVLLFPIVMQSCEVPHVLHTWGSGRRKSQYPRAGGSKL